MCVCEPGFESSAEDRSKCQDIDECANNSTCHASETCINSEGSFSCDCGSGYRKNTVPNFVGEVIQNDWKIKTKLKILAEVWLAMFKIANIYLFQLFLSCVNVDECSENPNLCNGKNEECHDTDGAYECKCKSGFQFFELLNSARF